MKNQSMIRAIFLRVVKKIKKIIYAITAIMKKTTITKMKTKNIKQKCMNKKIKAIIGLKQIICWDL
jgi:hypothetical protein